MREESQHGGEFRYSFNLKKSLLRQRERKRQFKEILRLGTEIFSDGGKLSKFVNGGKQKQ